jgi:hypothetical protein
MKIYVANNTGKQVFAKIVNPLSIAVVTPIPSTDVVFIGKPLLNGDGLVIADNEKWYYLQQSIVFQQTIIDLLNQIASSMDSLSSETLLQGAQAGVPNTSFGPKCSQLSTQLKQLAQLLN